MISPYDDANEIRPGLAKHVLKNRILRFVYLPFHAKAQTSLLSIIDDNTKLSAYFLSCFYFRGKFYAADPDYMRSYLAQYKLKANPLDRSLHPRMVAYLAELDRIEVDLHLVTTYLNQVLCASESTDDYKQILPECLHKPLQEYTWLPGYCWFPPVLDPTAIDELNERHQRAIKLIKYRLMLAVVS